MDQQTFTAVMVMARALVSLEDAAARQDRATREELARLQAENARLTEEKDT